MRRLDRRKRVLISIVVGFFFGLIFFLISPRIFFALLSLVGILIFLVSALVMVVTFRKVKSVSPFSLMTGIGLSALIALIYPAITGAAAGIFMPMAGLVFGSVTGLGWGATNGVLIENGVIRCRRNAWYLLIWALSLAIPQGAAIGTGRSPALALLLLFFGTGLVLGQSGLTLFRYYLLKPKLASASQTLP